MRNIVFAREDEARSGLCARLSSELFEATESRFQTPASKGRPQCLSSGETGSQPAMYTTARYIQVVVAYRSPLSPQTREGTAGT